MKCKSKKGFTLIELIVVIAIIGVLVLLAAPKFLGYVQKTHLARIQNDVKVAENFVTDKLLFNDNKLPSNWEKINTNELTELTQEKKLYDIRGIVVDKDNIEKGDYFKLAERPFNTKLKGNFYTNQGGKVYYEDLKSGKITDENSNEGELDGSEKDKVNKDALIIKKEEADKLNPSDYEDFTNVENAINKADKVIKDDDATQKEIDKAKQDLEDAIKDLIEKPVNKEDLISKKNEAEALDPNDYENFTDVEKAIVEADKIIKDDNATQKEVDKAKKDLEDAMKELIKKPSIPDHYVKASDADFEWVPYAYGAAYETNKGKGYYKYIGSHDYVEIPHEINGNAMVSYYYMFNGNKFVPKGIASTNSNITDMSSMFFSSAGTSVDLSFFDTSNVEDMSMMFYRANFDRLDLSPIDTSNVVNMKQMFGASSMLELNLNIDTSNVVNMYNMFYNTKVTETIDFSNLDISNVETMEKMFEGYQGGNIIFQNKNALKLKNVENMFSGTTVEVVNLDGWNTPILEKTCIMFQNSKTNKISIKNWNNPSIIDMSSMFTRTSANSINLEGLNTSNVTDMRGMFNGTTNLKQLDVSMFNTSKVLNMEDMFNSSGIEHINLSSFNTAKVEKMRNMFQKSKAITLNLSSFNTSSITGKDTMNAMFREMPNISVIDISSFDITHLKPAEQMFTMFMDTKNITIYVKNEATKKHLTDNYGAWIENNIVKVK